MTLVLRTLFGDLLSCCFARQNLLLSTLPLRCTNYGPLTGLAAAPAQFGSDPVWTWTPPLKKVYNWVVIVQENRQLSSDINHLPSKCRKKDFHCQFSRFTIFARVNWLTWTLFLFSGNFWKWTGARVVFVAGSPLVSGRLMMAKIRKSNSFWRNDKQKSREPEPRKHSGVSINRIHGDLCRFCVLSHLHNFNPFFCKLRGSRKKGIFRA